VVYCNLKTWPLIEFLQKIIPVRDPSSPPESIAPDYKHDRLVIQYFDKQKTLDVLLNGKTKIEGLTVPGIGGKKT
jgi:hypothetical protein